MANAPDHELEHIRSHNRRAWNAMVERRQRFTKPARDRDVAQWQAVGDANSWLPGSLHGLRLLCLGGGGGSQSAVYAAAGAEVTVVDLSPAMLALDRQIAAERRYQVRTIETSMDDLSMLEPAAFDVVVQPVSTCYVPDVVAVYRQVARVLRAGGLYLSQHKQPASLQGDVTPSSGGYLLREPYYRQGPLTPVAGSQHREEGTLEFLHRWEDLIGGLCRSGFVVEDLVEPFHARTDADADTFAHRSRYLPPYVRIRARRVAQSDNGAQAPPPTLWAPTD
jgi:SAM-dependent methyltransferase